MVHSLFSVRETEGTPFYMGPLRATVIEVTQRHRLPIPLGPSRATLYTCALITYKPYRRRARTWTTRVSHIRFVGNTCNVSRKGRDGCVSTPTRARARNSLRKHPCGRAEGLHFSNPRRACAARVTVCVSAALFSHLAQLRGKQATSATSASHGQQK